MQSEHTCTCIDRAILHTLPPRTPHPTTQTNRHASTAPRRAAPQLKVLSAASSGRTDRGTAHGRSASRTRSGSEWQGLWRLVTRLRWVALGHTFEVGGRVVQCGVAPTFQVTLSG
eukprot:359956-Chlamydomonas_euryale.AAC.8